MVKRLELGGYYDEVYMEPDDTGRYVLYSDYLALQKALGEALDGWEKERIRQDWDEQDEIRYRVSQLRSLYLGGGKESGASDHTP